MNAIDWLLKIFQKYFLNTKSDNNKDNFSQLQSLYLQLIKNVLFLDSTIIPSSTTTPLSIYISGEILPENEKLLYKLLTQEIPIFEETILKITNLSLYEIIEKIDTLDILEKLLWKASNYQQQYKNFLDIKVNYL